MDIPKYSSLKQKYNKIEIVSKSKREVISKFIKNFSDENIKVFQVVGFITYEEYQKEYFNHHFKIASYYGHLSQKSYYES